MTKPVSARRKRRSPEELRDLILAAAAAEFEDLGYGGATTAAIARRAETTEAQIFRLFSSKADLFRAAVFEPLNRHFEEFHARQVRLAAEGATRRDMAAGYIAELQDFVARHSRMLMSLIVAGCYTPGASGGLAEIDGLNAYFERGAAMMAARVGNDAPVPPALMVRASFAAVLANVMFRDWLYPAGIADDEAIRRAIADFTIGGIRINEPGI